MSATQTTTLPNGTNNGPGTAPAAGQKVDAEKLPPPNKDIDPDKEDDYSTEVDLLSDVDNEREVFTDQYKNADYLLKDYRYKLRAILEVNHEERDAAYKILSNAIFLHKKAHFKPVQEQLLEWAKKGYKGEPPEDYFDADGKKRAMSEQEDPEYTQRQADIDVTMEEDTPGLPQDMAFYEIQWRRATPLLEKLFRTPKLFFSSKGNIRAGLTRINYELNKKQLEDRCGTDLKVPFLEMLYVLVYGSESAFKVNSGLDTERDEKLSRAKHLHEILKLRIGRAKQPQAWLDCLDKHILQKVALMGQTSGDWSTHSCLWDSDFGNKIWANLDQPAGGNDGANSTGNGSEGASTGDQQQPKASYPQNEGTSSSTGDQQQPKASYPRNESNSSSATGGPEHWGAKPRAGAKGPSAANGPSPFQASKKKGFVRYKFSADRVTYQGQERKIGYSRRAGKFLYGEAYQLFVQINDDGATVPLWDIVPSSNFDRGVVKRFHDGGGQEISEMRGTKEDIGDRTIDDFNFGGIATIPRTTGAGYMKKPMQYILGCFDGGTEKFWARSTLGQVWRQKAIDGIIERLILQAGGVLPAEPEMKPKRKTRRKRKVVEDSDDEDEDEDHGEDM